MRALIKKLLRLLEPALPSVVDISIPHEVLGNEAYGAWATVTNGLTPASVVYSFGVGEDVSWDLALIKKTGATIHAFDPTPKSIAWVTQQAWPSQLLFHPYGIAAYDGVQHFTEPIKAHWVSYSPARKGSGVEAPVKKLATSMRELGHSHIDVLKMDIEGGEYAVIDDLLASHIFPTQILVEFHPHWRETGMCKTARTIKKLQDAGYKIFNVSKGGYDYSFIR